MEAYVSVITAQVGTHVAVALLQPSSNARCFFHGATYTGRRSGSFESERSIRIWRAVEFQKRIFFGKKYEHTHLPPKEHQKKKC